MDTTVVSVLSSHNGHVLNINQYLCSLSSFHMNILFQGKYNSVYSFLTWWFIFPRSNSLFRQASFTIAILVLTASSHCPSSVIHLLRYLYCDTCSNFVPSTIILQHIFPAFANRHRLHLFTFISIPSSLRVSLTVVVIICKLASLSLLKNTASLANLRLMKFCPQIFIPLTFRLEIPYHVFSVQIEQYRWHYATLSYTSSYANLRFFFYHFDNWYWFQYSELIKFIYFQLWKYLLFLLYTVGQHPPFYFLNNSVKKSTDFNDFWCVKSWENLTSVACTFANLTCIL